MGLLDDACRRMIGIATSALVAVGCGARTDIGAPLIAPSDATVGDTNPDAQDAGPACSPCGTMSDGTQCTAWIACASDQPADTDGAPYVCNDAPHQINCSCATGTCTCSSGAMSGATVAFAAGDCPCAFGVTQPWGNFLQTIVDACEF